MHQTRSSSRRYRRVWLGVTITVLGLGWVGALLTKSANVVFWTYVATWIMGGFGAVTYQLSDGRPAVSAPVLARRAVVFGSVFAAVFVALIGFVAIIGGWSLLVLVPLPLTSPALRSAVSHRLGFDGAEPEMEDPEACEPVTPPGESGASATRVDQPRQTICTMATSDLCHAWRASYVRLQRARTEAARGRIVAARQAYLDELARRNPAGFEAWLDAGARAASDPERFFGDDPGSGTVLGDGPGPEPSGSR